MIEGSDDSIGSDGGRGLSVVCVGDSIILALERVAMRQRVGCGVGDGDGDGRGELRGEPGRIGGVVPAPSIRCVCVHSMEPAGNS